jgi:ATP-binding cassette subfamily F protein uup
MAMDGAGKVEYYAELAQWEQANAAKKVVPAKPAAKLASQGAVPAKKRLSFNEAREWEQMEETVLRAEEVLDRKRSQLEVPEVVADPAKLTVAVREMDAAQNEVDKLYARWAELEAKRNESKG